MIASNNPFPSILVVEQASTPSTPAAGRQRFFVRSSDGHACRVDDSGAVTDLEDSAIDGATGSTDNALLRADGTGGTTVQASALVVSDAGAITFPDGVRQTFNPDATNAGLNVGSVAGDPSAPSDGDLWYDSTANELTARINGASVALGAGGGGIGGATGGTDNAILRADGTGGSTVQASAISISDAGALSLPDDVRQTFNPGANNAGVNVGSISGDPASPSNGDIWYDSNSDELTARIAGANVALGAVGGGGSGDVSAVGTLTSGQLVIGQGSTDVAVGNLTGDITTSGSTATTLKTAAKTRAITLGIDGGGSAITTGVKADVYVPYACTITAVTMLADQSGSIVVDIWADTYANFPPIVGDSITAAAKPTISAATKSQDTTLTGWTTSLAAGSILRFNVDSASTVTRLNLILTVTV